MIELDITNRDPNPLRTELSQWLSNFYDTHRDLVFEATRANRTPPHDRN
jgi:hypothetical protein